MSCLAAIAHGRFLARLGHKLMGRACPLCPGTSDIHLLGYCQGVVDFDPKIPNSALDLGVTE
jgi:hypothetical protein